MRGYWDLANEAILVRDFDNRITFWSLGRVDYTAGRRLRRWTA